MNSMILSEFDSCKLSVEEMNGTKGGSTLTKGNATSCSSGDSDSGKRDSDDNTGGGSLQQAFA